MPERVPNDRQPKRRVVLYPDPVLRKKAHPVARVDAAVRELVEDMFVVMDLEDGDGLAAPQVGESLRIFVTCPLYGEPERVFINPRLETTGEIVGGDEGCLSLPDIRAEIMRPPSARITALDLDGSEFTLEMDGIWARVWQHEFDHLEGTMIIDRMRPLDRLANRRALRDLERSAPRRES